MFGSWVLPGACHSPTSIEHRFVPSDRGQSVYLSCCNGRLLLGPAGRAAGGAGERHWQAGRQAGRASGRASWHPRTRRRAGEQASSRGDSAPSRLIARTTPLPHHYTSPHPPELSGKGFSARPTPRRVLYVVRFPLWPLTLGRGSIGDLTRFTSTHEIGKTWAAQKKQTAHAARCCPTPWLILPYTAVYLTLHPGLCKT
jgi:hypothetical protein